MKPRRLGDWKRIAERAERALHAREWWDGKCWRPHDDLPSTEVEARAYRSAHDVLDEALRAMTAADAPAEHKRAARRFARSIEADRDESSASTFEEAIADLIFERARPYLRKKPFRNRPGFPEKPAPRTAWKALAQHLGITPNRLRMICRQRGAK